MDHHTIYLVRESPGPQYYDGYNDVAWLPLARNILSVTWYSTVIHEAEMALNTKFAWWDDGVHDYDVETVFLHQNGHVVGLGHSSDASAVMYPTYQGIQRNLVNDDCEGVTYLYDTGVTGIVS